VGNEASGRRVAQPALASPLGDFPDNAAGVVGEHAAATNIAQPNATNLDAEVGRAIPTI
jgi:hypothetical protein